MKIYDLTKHGVCLSLSDIGLDTQQADSYQPTNLADVGYFRCAVGNDAGKVFFTRARMNGFLLWTPVSVIALKEKVSEGAQPQVIELMQTEAGVLYHVQEVPLVICQSNFSGEGGRSRDHYVIISQTSSAAAPSIHLLPC